MSDLKLRAIELEIRALASLVRQLDINRIISKVDSINDTVYDNIRKLRREVKELREEIQELRSKDNNLEQFRNEIREEIDEMSGMQLDLDVIKDWAYEKMREEREEQEKKEREQPKEQQPNKEEFLNLLREFEQS